LRDSSGGSMDPPLAEPTDNSKRPEFAPDEKLTQGNLRAQFD
jgi:hypothetical protein